MSKSASARIQAVRSLRRIRSLHIAIRGVDPGLGEAWDGYEV